MFNKLIAVPQVLGHYYSFASIEGRVAGQLIQGFTSINYSQKLDVGQVYGTKPQKLGTTRGKHSCEASAEMYVQDWEYLRGLLGAKGIGYGETRFPITVTYGELGLPTKTDVLVGCRIIQVSYSNSDGTDASKVSLTFDVMRLLEGLKDSMVAPLGII